MFGIGDKGCTDTEDELWVNLDVGVDQHITGLLLLASEFIQFLLVIVEWYLELLLKSGTIRHDNLDRQFCVGNPFLTHVQPLDGGRIAGASMLGADVREVEWSWGHEKIFLFLRTSG